MTEPPHRENDMDHPIGTFNDAEITDHGFGESGEKKTPHLWVIFKTDHGELQGYFYLTDKSAQFTMEKLVHMGLPAGSDWDQAVAGLESGELLQGNLVQLEVESDSYSGTPRPKVKTVRSNNYEGGHRRSETAAANVKKFGALWRKTKGDAVPTVMGVPQPDDSDCPF